MSLPNSQIDPIVEILRLAYRRGLVVFGKQGNNVQQIDRPLDSKIMPLTHKKSNHFKGDDLNRRSRVAKR